MILFFDILCDISHRCLEISLAECRAGSFVLRKKEEEITEKTFKVVNTTPHTVKVVGENGVTAQYAPCGSTIRLKQETIAVGRLPDGTILTRTQYGEPVFVTPEGEKPLPAPKEGVWFIVSAMVKGALGNRADLLVPAEQVRDDQGRVIGCRSLGL